MRTALATLAALAALQSAPAMGLLTVRLWDSQKAQLWVTHSERGLAQATVQATAPR